MFFSRVALLASLAASAAATFDIVSPSQDVWWVAKSINTLTWDCNSADAKAHPTFTVLVANTDPKVLVAPLAIIGIQNNFDCSKTITQDQLSAPAGTGYTILFANTLNQSDIYTTSQPFEIKALGSAYPTSTHGIAGASTSSPSGTSGANAANSTSTSTKGNGASALAASAQVGGLLGLVGLVMGLVL